MAKRPDADIDDSDPEIPNIAEWEGFVRGKFYRPVKQPITIRIDADVLAWFKSKGGKYQVHINRVLRKYVAGQQGDSPKRKTGGRS